jgi:hypothetical protein
VKFNAIVLLLCFTLISKAQFLDTIKFITHKKPSIDARLESRHSFIKNDLVKVTGVRLGLIFQKKLKVGIGYSWLKSNVTNNLAITNYLGKPDTVKNFLKFGYIAYYADFVFHKTKRWQLSVPLQLGTGLAWFKYNNGNEDIKSKKHFLSLYEPGITVQFKITKWLGLGADIGYRFTLKNTQYVGDKLNSPTYAFKLMLWFDQLFYIATPNFKLTKKYGPAAW